MIKTIINLLVKYQSGAKNNQERSSTIYIR